MAKAKKNKMPKGKAAPRPQSSVAGVSFSGLDDPALKEYIRNGSIGGVMLGGSRAMSNSALFRCICLISQCVGMLPLNLQHADDDKAIASEHPVFHLLKRKPNGFQTAYTFKTLMQGWVLQHGNAYARVVRSNGRVVALIPVHPSMMRVEQNDDFSLKYTYTRKDGAPLEFGSTDILHLRDFSENGLTGISRVELARRALGISFDAEEAAARMFSDGVMAGGALSTPNRLSNEAYERLHHSMQERHAGAENAGKFLILEEGLKAEKWAQSASEAQHLQNRNHQIEEVARFFAVPRPLLMMDDTSWGSGIGELGIFFLKYGLLPWFTMWEQALSATLLNDKEQDTLMFKFNAGALLRGSLKDQAEFFAKALGSGGHGAWMTQNEVREVSDMPRAEDEAADSLRQALLGKQYTTQPVKE